MYNEIKSEYEKIFDAYEINGVVTRVECGSLDSRTFGRKVEKVMKDKGYYSACYMEYALENYGDYLGAVFDTERYTIKSVMMYLEKDVLSDYFSI